MSTNFAKHISLITILIYFILFLLIFSSGVFAQLPDFSFAVTYQVESKDIEDGDLVSLSVDKPVLVRTDKAYDERLYGVYIKNPKIVYNSPGNDDPIVRNGEVDVNITTLNGEINIGDYVSSSPIPGKAQVATEFTGYMLGIALNKFTNKDGTEFDYQGKKYRIGKVKVAVGIGPASPAVIKAAGGFFGTLRSISSSFLYNISTSRRLERIIRYILAILVAILSIYLSLRFFGKNVTKGIEAIGRNPLARMAIQTMIIVNIILITIIAIGGISLALVILSL